MVETDWTNIFLKDSNFCFPNSELDVILLESNMLEPQKLQEKYQLEGISLATLQSYLGYSVLRANYEGNVLLFDSTQKNAFTQEAEAELSKMLQLQPQSLSLNKSNYACLVYQKLCYLLYFDSPD